MHRLRKMMLIGVGGVLISGTITAGALANSKTIKRVSPTKKVIIKTPTKTVPKLHETPEQGPTKSIPTPTNVKEQGPGKTIPTPKSVPESKPTKTIPSTVNEPQEQKPNRVIPTPQNECCEQEPLVLVPSTINEECPQEPTRLVPSSINNVQEQQPTKFVPSTIRADEAPQTGKGSAAESVEKEEKQENEVTGKGSLPQTGDGMNPLVGSLGLTSMISFGTVYIKSRKKLTRAISNEKVG
jgi:LPXTG-motif cell wall-anchored protein